MSFSETIPKEAERLTQRAQDVLNWANIELRGFYARKGNEAYHTAKQIGGLKLVLGGGSVLRQSQLNSVLSSLLFADTVLVPDPVMPWFEVERTGEAFRYPRLLESIFAVLFLKPIIEANLPYPAVLVFPSFEKSLEQHNTTTQKSIQHLITEVLFHYVDNSIVSFDDASQFVSNYPEQFLEAVDKHGLLVAPSGPPNESWDSALRRYEEYCQYWRTPEWLEKYSLLPSSHKVLNIIMERLVPQFHLLENSDELNSHPLLCIEEQAHYFRLVSKINSSRLKHMGLLDPKTQALVEALQSKRLKPLLSGISMDDLVELRISSDNKSFQSLLKSSIEEMHEAALEDTNKVVAQVCHALIESRKIA